MAVRWLLWPAHSFFKTMASVKIKLGRLKLNGERPLEIELIHMRKHREIPIGINIKPEAFINGAVKKGYPFADKINQKISHALNAANECIIDHTGQHIHINELKRIITSRMGYSTKTPPLSLFTKTLMDELKATKREGNAITLNAATVALIKHVGHEITLTQIDYNMLFAWRNAMQQTTLKNSTIHNYLRTIRTIWNQAKNRGIINNESPFKPGLMPAINKPDKKAVSTLTIQHLAMQRPKLIGRVKLAVDARLLQFYLQGIDIADLALIKRKQIKDNYITFTRFKNRNKSVNPSATVQLNHYAQAIVNDYKGEYLLPFKCTPEDAHGWHNEVSALDKLVNNLLKRNDIKEKFGAKAARHTWLTLANALTDNYLLIKHAVGHSVGDTTAKYIKINQTDIDNLNMQVISTSSLKSTNSENMAV